MDLAKSKCGAPHVHFLLDFLIVCENTIIEVIQYICHMQLLKKDSIAGIPVNSNHRNSADKILSLQVKANYFLCFTNSF